MYMPLWMLLPLFALVAWLFREVREARRLSGRLAEGIERIGDKAIAFQSDLAEEKSLHQHTKWQLEKVESALSHYQLLNFNAVSDESRKD
jgi:hypothetical protein